MRLRLLLLALVVATAGRADTTPALHDGHGISVVSARAVDDRQLDVRVATDALQRPVDVRILLPAGYAGAADRRWPVLYLFHGTSGRASDWVSFGRAEETTATLPLIVVMPDAGFDGDGGGWFTDWFNGGAGGQPMWETFHVGQLIPWVDDNLRTIRLRRGRAIAGLSQGGFGSLSYAARHPELFTSAAAFSGACVVDRDPQAITVSTGIIQYTASTLDGADPDAMFGPRATNELNWQAHDPGTLVTNLRGMQIALWTGDGTAGPLDRLPLDPLASAIEAITFGATRLFDGYLTEVGIHHIYDDYGGGTHTFAYWARDLEQYVRPLMRRFRHPPARPRTIDYLSAADHWRQWGWDVSLQRPSPGFSRLRAAGARGFVLTGTGRAHLRTPRFYDPGDRLHVTGRNGSTDVTVGPSGRARLTVPLGDGTAPRTVRVRIERAR